MLALTGTRIVCVRRQSSAHRESWIHMMLILRRLAVPAAFTLGAALATPALAALGGSVDSVTADQQAMRGQLVATPYVQYDVQQIVRGALTVNEYVSRAGQVFAITWQGPTPPNLQQLLGAYFARFQSAAAAAHQANPGIHRQVLISQADLVVQASGRLRDFRGIAYLPGLLPAGVSLSQLQ